MTATTSRRSGAASAAMIAAGVSLEWLHEHDEIAWRLLPVLVPGGHRQYRWPDGFVPRLPLSLSLSARRR